jgi:hypothetical protein
MRLTIMFLAWLLTIAAGLHLNSDHLQTTASKELIVTVWSQTEYIEGTSFIPRDATYDEMDWKHIYMGFFDVPEWLAQ